MNRLFLVALIFCLRHAALAQSAPPGALAVPYTGVVFDAAHHALRDIIGLPGASQLGLPQGGELAIRRAALLPGTRTALALVGADLRLRFLRLGDGGIAAEDVPGALLSPDLLAASAGGTAAVLFDKSRRVLQVITGLPAKPSVTHQWEDVPTASEIRLLAVSDDGRAVLAAAGDGVAAPVWWFRAGTAPRQLAVAGTVRAMSFAPASLDAVMAGPGWVTLLRGLDRQPEYHSLGIHPEQPLAAEFSADGARVFVMDHAQGSVLVAGAAGLEAAVSCDCRPTEFVRLSGSLFALTGADGGRILLFDAGRVEPRFWFVPAAGGVE